MPPFKFMKCPQIYFTKINNTILLYINLNEVIFVSSYYFFHFSLVNKSCAFTQSFSTINVRMLVQNICINIFVHIKFEKHDTVSQHASPPARSALQTRHLTILRSAAEAKVNSQHYNFYEYRA